MIPWHRKPPDRIGFQYGTVLMWSERKELFLENCPEGDGHKHIPPGLISNNSETYVNIW